MTLATLQFAVAYGRVGIPGRALAPGGNSTGNYTAAYGVVAVTAGPGGLPPPPPSGGTITFDGFVTGLGPILAGLALALLLPAAVLRLRGGNARRRRDALGANGGPFEQPLHDVLPRAPPPPPALAPLPVMSGGRPGYGQVDTRQFVMFAVCPLVRGRFRQSTRVGASARVKPHILVATRTS